MIEEAIGLGLAINLVFSETLGLAAGGLVVPGYLALMVHTPLRIVGTVLVSLVTLGLLRLLERVMLIYGRRRIVAAVLLGFVVGELSRGLMIVPVHGSALDFRLIGFVIPGLIANWMDRQGVIQTVCVMVTTTVVVRLLLVLLHGGGPVG